MEDIKINDNIMDILNNPNLQKVDEYVEILEKTNEFTVAISDIFREVYNALEDGVLTLNEIRKIGVKMFSFLVKLKDNKFKFEGLSSEESNKLKELIKEDLDNFLTNLVVKAIKIIKKRAPNLAGKINENDIRLIVGTIVDTANFSIEIIEDKCPSIFVCCK